MCVCSSCWVASKQKVISSGTKEDLWHVQAALEEDAPLTTADEVLGPWRRFLKTDELDEGAW